MIRVPFTYYPDEIMFLKNNFFSMTNQSLLDSLNSNRPETDQLRLPGMIHQCRRLGLKRHIQIRWTEKEIKYLINNYKKKGNKEIGLILTRRNKTDRKFTRKNVEKKMKLLRLKRTPEQILGIISRNRELGWSTVFSKEKPGKKATPEGTIKTWNLNGKKRNVIKINGRYIQNAKYQYEKIYGPTPQGFKVYHRDMDSINDDPNNLYTRKGSGISKKDYQVAIPLIEKRISDKKKKIRKSDTRKESQSLMFELNYLYNHLSNLNNKTN